MIQYLDAVDAGIVGTVMIIFYYLFFIKITKSGYDRKPPVAAGGWPLIGHLHILGGDAPYITLGDLADKYGPIFSIKIGVHSAVVVSSWELAKECFTKHDLIVSTRPKFVAAKILAHDYANFGFSPYGDFWREMRKIATLMLLSTRRFEMLRGIRDSEAEISVKDVYRAWVEKRDGDDFLLVEMKQWFGDLNLNVVLRMVAGKRYSAESTGEPKLRRVRKALRDFFRLMGVLVLGDAIPALGWLDIDGRVKEMKKVAEEMDSIVSEWLEEHRRKRDSGDSKTEQDFIDVLLSVLDGADLAGYDPVTINKATCLMIISAATDTTAVTMIWTLALLMNNRYALKKIKDELDEHVGKERLVNESDLSKLVYLQAVAKESMRLYPAAPLSGPREFTEDCTLRGYNIKAGTRLTLNLWKMHRDPRVWEDPLEFRPERFLSTHKEVDVKGQHFELLPFGGGRRACPGVSFGLQMTLLAIASFLQAFEVATPSNASVDMGATFGLTTIKSAPLEVMAKPRLSPSLYQ